MDNLDYPHQTTKSSNIYTLPHLHRCINELNKFNLCIMTEEFPTFNQCILELINV